MARKRVVLNLATVREIESLAPSFAESMRRGTKSQLSNALSARFGVDAKTISDIWNRKSWKRFNPHNSNNSTDAETIADSFLRSDHDNPEQWENPQLTLQNLLQMNSTHPY
jgi:hypothetical protein